MLQNIFERASELKALTEDDYKVLIEADLDELMKYAEKLKLKFMGDKPQTCAIINARSGLCSEDCAFCAQSSHFDTGAPVYDFIDLDKIASAAKDLAEKGVERFSIVTSGIGPDGKEFEKIKEGIKVIKENGIIPDVSVGCMSYEKLMELKEVGMDAYHHNLEVSRTFFDEICSTHEYDRDVQTVKDAVDAGLYVCSGGIFGLGEKWEHRIELAETLRELKVQSVPVNFLNPIKGTPMYGREIMSEDEALRVIAIYRFILPDRSIRVCGGRSIVFKGKDSAQKVLKAGASGVMVGDYLTVKGVSLDDDIELLK